MRFLKILFLALVMGSVSPGCGILSNIDEESEARNQLVEEVVSLKAQSESYQRNISDQEEKMAMCRHLQVALQEANDMMKGQIQKGRAGGGMEETWTSTDQSLAAFQARKKTGSSFNATARTSALREEARKTPMDELRREASYYRFLNAILLKTVQDREAEVSECDGKVQTLREGRDTLRVQLRKIEEDRQFRATQAAVLSLPEIQEEILPGSKLRVANAAEPEKKEKTPPPVKKPPEEVKKAPSKSIRLKVLTGDGTLTSARKMAARLGKMGYPVQAIGFASRSNYKKNTVSCSRKFQAEGKKLAKALGKNTVTRLLTETPEFDCIVITGQ